MKEVQPPIENDEQLEAYRDALRDIERIMRGYEAEVVNYIGQPEWEESARTKLFRTYRIRQGFIDAIAEYLRQQRQSA